MGGPLPDGPFWLKMEAKGGFSSLHVLEKGAKEAPGGLRSQEKLRWLRYLVLDRIELDSFHMSAGEEGSIPYA
jgi:hypothetical protein